MGFNIFYCVCFAIIIVACCFSKTRYLLIDVSERQTLESNKGDTLKNYENLNARFIPLEHRQTQITPMNYGEIQSIKVDIAKKECKLNLEEYYIRKDVRTLLPGKAFFFASTHEEFVPNDDVNPIPHDSIDSDQFIQIMENQFENQIGFAMCSNGWIDKVRVKSEQDLDARNCGIGTVFTILCMIDPELHLLPNFRIDSEFNDDFRTAKTIKKGCRRFMGLLMAADPLTGAYGYFNAALKNGYDKLLIKTDKEKYQWMDTEKAKKCYNDMTGKIGNGITGYKKNWWFCESIPGKFPKFASIDRCLKPNF